MRYSVLIVNWKTTDLLVRCLQSLERYPADGDWEAVVVDNATPGFNADEIASVFPFAKVIAVDSNQGFAAGNNMAFQHSRGQQIVILNPDTEVTQGALEKLLSFVDSHPSTAIAAPQLVFPDGQIQWSCRSFPYPAYLLWISAGLARLFPSSKYFTAYRMRWFDHNHTIQVDQPMASCWVLPRIWYERVGGFDEEFPNLFNDVAFAWDVKSKGGEIWFVAESKVIHVGGQGTSQGGYRIHEESHHGLVRFYNKYMKCASPWTARKMGEFISWINLKYRTRGMER